MSQDVILDAILSSEGQSAAKIEYKETRFSEDYLILSDGRLYSRASRRFLTPKLNNVGYYEYVISRKKSSNGKALGTVQQAHRLVAEAFIPNPDNLPYVHHINENKLDNSVDNLQWVSAAYNSQEHLKKNLPKKRRSKEKYVCGESDLENEKWVSVKDFPNYMISNMGRIRNTKGGWFVQPDIPKDVDTGYARITLRRDGKNHRFSVHRLVYSTFSGDYDLDGYVIDHINHDTCDNRFENLRKVTVSENNRSRRKSRKNIQ